MKIHAGPSMFNLQSINQMPTHAVTCGVTIDLRHGTLDHAIEHGRSWAAN